MRKLCLGVIAAIVLNVSAFATVQFTSVTTYSQEQPLTTSLSLGLVTHIQGNLPMTIDVANVNEATSFRINSSAMWQGNNFQVLLGQDPAYKPGAKTAKISVPGGTVQLSWTATNLTFNGVLVDNYSAPSFPGFPLITPIPLGLPGPFTNSSSISVHFQYYDYTHVATMVGTNKLVTYTTDFSLPGLPPTTTYVTVNTGQFSITADLQPPVIKFNSPAQNTVVTSSDVNINLTVSDNVALGYGPIWLGGGSVLSYSIDGGGSYGDANTFPGGPTTHSINFNGLLSPGTNVITFIAADSSGNLGTNTIVLFFAEKSPIALATVGVGSITGATNGQQLFTGRNYTLVAKPGTGKVFAGWTDDTDSLVSRRASYTFTMHPGLTLTASFADTPFASVAGSYFGYFQAHGFTATPGTIGGVKLTVTSAGTFSGTLTSGAGSGAFSGTFLYYTNGLQQGSASVVTPSSTNRVDLQIVTDPSQENYGVVQGHVFFGNNIGVKTITPNRPVYYADLNAGRATNASVLPGGAGIYHFSVNPATNDVNFPSGYGFGTLTVAANGSVTGSITLPDVDAPMTTFSSQLVYTGYLPVVVPLYNKAGGFVMGANLAPVQTNGDWVNVGTAVWVKAAGKTS
ncbi:MAG: InlB B-repeat-containing protein, partial [Limisphaerales bacterium]